jgi:hypothetical protein
MILYYNTILSISNVLRMQYADKRVQEQVDYVEKILLVQHKTHAPDHIEKILAAQREQYEKAKFDDSIPYTRLTTILKFLHNNLDDVSISPTHQSRL